MTTRTQARDQILTLFRTAWLTLTPPVPPLLFDDVKADIPAATSPWARVSIQTYGGEQATFGQAGNRHFDHFGVVTVQIFTPAFDGLDLSDTLVQAAQDAFEGQSTPHIWFKNVRAVDIGSDGDWYNVNVQADFLYTNIK